MKEELKNIPLERNEAEQRFEITLDGHTAFISYKEDGKRMELIHTESPEALAGRGVASALADKTLEYLRNNGYKVIPSCPFVFAYMKRHPQWDNLRVN